MGETQPISFRAASGVKAWLRYSAKGFTSEGELLNLILSRAAIEQVIDTGITAQVNKLFKRKKAATSVGDTSVYGARVSLDMAELIKQCAAGRKQSASEWCAGVVLSWCYGFQAAIEKSKQPDLAKYGELLRAKVAALSNVYAQKLKK